MKNILIVGAGLSGVTIARLLAEAKHNVVVIDQRDHIAGNAYDYYNEYDIRVHKYGPHIFHTNNEEVYNWLGQFTDWVEYKHKVKAILNDGTYVTLPVNKETTKIVGEENILDTFFRPYTLKMWGKTLEELDPSIINRVPIRTDMNELYFPNDKYQAMPKYGYTKMVKNILDHENISINLNTNFNKLQESHYDHIFNSMPIDVYFDSCYGELPYRSLKFHTVTIPSPKVLPVPTVNFTHDGPYTRITEWKNYIYHGENNKCTTLTYEEPCDYKDNSFERYYPVKDVDGKNREVYKQYRADIPDNVTFIGRCGQYVYIDMDMAVASASATAKRFLNND
jgi:UDP-galactopyranose mutase